MIAALPISVGRCLAAALVLFATGCSLGEPDDSQTTGPSRLPAPEPDRSPSGTPELTDVHEVIATDLDIPWDIDFLPDGVALVTERPTGRILRFGPESDADGLRASEAQIIQGVNDEGEGGLLGIAVSPEYESDGWIFAYHSTDSDNRIVRFALGGEPEPIVTGIPHARIHNGGRLAFGPDGYLYATVGDGNVPDRAQDPDDLRGSVLRMTTDGGPAPDNPFDSLVWAYGLRNPQGLAWDSAGQLWVTEFGADAVDEVNLVAPGANFGWPICEGRCEPGGDDPGAEDPALDDLVDPVVTWSTSEASCSGAAVVGRTLVAACLRGQRLWLMELTDSGSILGAPRPALVEVYGRLRAAVVAPDGSLWLTTSNRDGRLPGGAREGDDRIIRLVISGAGAAGAA